MNNMNMHPPDNTTSSRAVIMCIGHPSTGKTSSTQRLHFELSGEHNVELLTSMSVRTRLGFMDDLHSEEKRQRVYDEIANEVEKRLEDGAEVVILDGNFNKRSRREAVYRLSDSHDASVFVVRCTVPDESEIRERLDARSRDFDKIENKASTLELYNMIKDCGDAVDGDLLPCGSRPSIIEYDTVNQTVNVVHKNYRNSGDRALMERISRCLAGPADRNACQAAGEATTFIFDIGGVIQSLRWESVSNRLNAIKPNITMDDFRNALYLEKESCFGLYEVDALDSHKFWTAIAARLDLAETCIPEIQESFGHLYGCADAAVIGSLRKLKKNHRLIVLSNSCPELELAVRGEGDVYDVFDEMYFSHRIGFKKPDRRAFEYVLDAQGLKPRECVFVDDLARNVNAAEELGIRGMLYLSPRQLEKDLAPYL